MNTQITNDTRIYFNSLILFLICLMLAVGAFQVFPLYDDGWFTLMLRESVPNIVAQNMRDRPVMGFLFEKLMGFGSAFRIVLVVLNAVLWLALAIEATMLFQELFPELKNYSIVAACATLAPIVVQTQLSTVVVSISANLASILSYAAILILLKQCRADPIRPLLLGSASILAVSSVMLSEYGVATNLVGLIILAGSGLTHSAKRSFHRALLWAACLLTLTAAAYVAFTKVADFRGRPDVSPVQMTHHTLFQLVEIPFDVVTGAWHSWIAAYATALGSIAIEWDSKSTIVGVFFGCLIAFLLCIGTQKSSNAVLAEVPLKRLTGRMAFLSLGLLIGLLPFKAMGRSTTLLEYGSRFRIPILPLASVLTVALVLNLVRRPLRWAAVATLGFIIGYSSWTFTYVAIQNHRTIASYGKALAPYVARTAGNTVAVVPINRFESELTATITSDWPLELEKKLWVVGESPARMQFGNRSTCRENTEIDVRMRGLTRLGKVDEFLWVEGERGKPILIEPYCRVANLR